MTNADSFLFLAFQTLPITLKIQKQLFSGCTVWFDSKYIELGSSDREVSPSASKITGVIPVSFCAWKCVLADISRSVSL